MTQRFQPSNHAITMTTMGCKTVTPSQLVSQCK